MQHGITYFYYPAPCMRSEDCSWTGKLKKYSLRQEGFSSNLMASSTALQLDKSFVAFAIPVSVSFE